MLVLSGRRGDGRVEGRREESGEHVEEVRECNIF
jgi:hypothetical protein